MSKRIFAMLLTVAMIINLFSGVVLASNTNGVVLDSDGYYRYYVDGEIQTKWQTSPDGYKYYFSTSASKYGAAMTGKNIRIGGAYYDFTDEGKLIESYDEQGNPVLYRNINGLYTDESGITKYYKDNEYQIGWQYINGYKYYFSKANGKMLSGYTQIGSVKYNLNSDGTWNGYYQTVYSEEECPSALDVVKDADGKYRYYLNETPFTGWKVLRGESAYYKYYFSKADGGAITTYATRVGSETYDFKPTGTLISVTIDENGNAVMSDYTLTLEQGAKNGITLDEDGKYRYYIDGEFQSGWIETENGKYLLRRADGSAITEKNYKYGSFWYDFTEDGKLIKRKNAPTEEPEEEPEEEKTVALTAEETMHFATTENGNDVDLMATLSVNPTTVKYGNRSYANSSAYMIKVDISSLKNVAFTSALLKFKFNSINVSKGIVPLKVLTEEQYNATKVLFESGTTAPELYLSDIPEGKALTSFDLSEGKEQKYNITTFIKERIAAGDNYIYLNFEPVCGIENDREKYSFADMKLEENFSIQATTVKNVTASFVDDKGTTVSKAVSVVPYNKVTLPEIPEKDGYFVNGWVCSADGLTYQAGENCVIYNTNVTFTTDYTEGALLTLENCDEESATQYVKGEQITLPLPVKTAKSVDYTFVNWTDGVNTYNAGDTITLNGKVTLKATWTVSKKSTADIAFDDKTLVKLGAYDDTTSAYDNEVKSVTSGATGTASVNTKHPISGSTYQQRSYVYVTLDLENEIPARKVTLNVKATPYSPSSSSYLYVNQVYGYPTVGGTAANGTRIHTIVLNSKAAGVEQNLDITTLYNDAVGSKLCFKLYGSYANDLRAANTIKLDVTNLDVTVTPVENGDFAVDFEEGAESIIADANETITLPCCTKTVSGRKFAGWTDGTNTYAEGAEYTVISNVTFTPVFEIDPENQTIAQKAFDGKKVIFIGNSYVYWGNCVIRKGRYDFHWNDRKDDIGYFHQLCKENGADVTVRNWCFSAHTIYHTFDGPCNNGIQCDGYSHEDLIKDKYFDYVFVSPHAASGEAKNIAENFDYVMNFFRQYNPNVKFIVLGNHAVRGVTNRDESFPGIYNYFPTLEEKGVIVADWGVIVKDIVDGTVEVPGSSFDYDINTFVCTGDGYHENALSGYLTALISYCAVTGEKAEGQPYEFCYDKTIDPEFDLEDYRSGYYKNDSDTNFLEIFHSPEEMRGLQRLVDIYLGNYVPVGVELTLENCDEPSVTEYESGTRVTLPEPSKAANTVNYTFKGWSDGEKTYNAGESIIVYEDMTLTATWESEPVNSVFAVEFDNKSLVKQGHYDETTATTDNTVKSITSGVKGNVDINARNTYSSNQGYLNRPYIYVKENLKNEVAADKVLLNLKGVGIGTGKIYAYSVSGYPEVGEEMEKGTLVATFNVSKTSGDTLQSIDITDVYNSAVGSELCLRIYGWYGNDKRYTNAVTVNADSISLTVSTNGTGAYTVSFDGGADNVMMDAGEITLPEYENVPEGKQFIGWSDGTTTYSAGDSYTVSGSVSFTALFIEPAVLTYDNNGTVTTQAYELGTTVTVKEPEVLTATIGSYAFEGWTDGTTTYNPGDSITLNENLTLTAVWKYTGGEGILNWIESWYFANPTANKAVTDTTIGTLTKNPTGAKYLFRGPSTGNKWTSAYYAKIDLRGLKNVSNATLSVYHLKFNTQTKASVYDITEADYNALFATAESGSTINTTDLPASTAIVTKTFSATSAAGTYRAEIDITDYIAAKVAAGADYAYIKVTNSVTATSATTDSWRVSDFAKSSYVTLTTADDITE